MARLINGFKQFFDSSGKPLAYGLIDFFESGSPSVRKPTYADIDETIPNENPVVLYGDGRCPNVFGTGTYNAILRTSTGEQVQSKDPIGGNSVLGFGADWSSTTVYSESEVVLESGSYWISLLPNNSGNKPSSDGGVNWQEFDLRDISQNTDDILLRAPLSGADFTGQINSTAGDLNLKTNTGLSDADAAITAAQLIGGELTITPTADRILTTDSAANIISALSGSVDNSNFEFTLVNLTGFSVTLSGGTGVTLVGGMSVNNGCATFRVRRLTLSTISVTRLETGYGKQILILEDRKASGVSGGTFTSGAWRTRDVNTVQKNAISGASLSGSQITLPAGEFIVDSWHTAYRVNTHKARLYNVTDSSVELYGSSEYSFSTNLVASKSRISGAISLSESKTFRFDHRCSATSSDGFGLASNFSEPEIYTGIIIEKVG